MSVVESLGACCLLFVFFKGHFYIVSYQGVSATETISLTSDALVVSLLSLGSVFVLTRVNI